MKKVIQGQKLGQIGKMFHLLADEGKEITATRQQYNLSAYRAQALIKLMRLVKEFNNK